MRKLIVDGMDFTGTSADFGTDYRAVNAYELIDSKPGRRLVAVDCPFCGEDIVGFAWSLAGSGKRCACGAVVGLLRARRTRKAL